MAVLQSTVTYTECMKNTRRLGGGICYMSRIEFGGYSSSLSIQVQIKKVFYTVTLYGTRTKALILTNSDRTMRPWKMVAACSRSAVMLN